MTAVPELDVNTIKKFHPFDSQSTAKVKEIIKKSAIHKLSANRVLFKKGDKDNWTIYLLSGTIELSLANGKKELIEGDTDSALNPISNQIPRSVTAKSQTDSHILIIDRSLLQIILNHNDGGIEVGSIDEDDEDWMTRFLQSNAFLQLPAANIQALMMRLREEHLSAGSVIIKENSPNDDKFYIIQQGTCLVTKINQSTGKEIILAQLAYGSGVGEEALITGGVRGASVIMETDGVIMTLEKKDFLELLVEPLIHRIKKDELNDFLLSGDSFLIDVRNEDESQHQQLDNTKHNIPLTLFRSLLGQLDIEKHYIIYSNHENRSSAAAFIFIQQGFDCSILEGGIGGKVETTESVESSTVEESSAGKKSSTPLLTSDLDSSTTEELIIEIPSDVITETMDRQIEKTPSTEQLFSKESLSEQLLTSENKRKKVESLAIALKAKAQEAIKFAKLKSKQLELSNQKLIIETERANQAEAKLKLAQNKIKKLKQ